MTPGLTQSNKSGIYRHGLNNFLLISPKFPPSNAIGSKRALNIVRHLPRYGWHPVVLAAPALQQECDNSVMKLLPVNTIVSYQFTSVLPEPSRPKQRTSNKTSLSKIIADRGPYYTPFDQYLSQVPAAIRAGKQLIRQYKPRLILVNADPWSGFIVGNSLSKWANIPWIADLRDPWSMHTFKMSLRPWLIRFLINYFESVFFHNAAKVILNTRMCSIAYQKKYRATLDNEHFTYIRNAFDPACYDKPQDSGGKNIFSLHYFGSFRNYQGPGHLFELFRQFVQKYKLNPDEAELVLYGEQREEDLQLIQNMKIPAYIRLHESVSLTDTLFCLHYASVLVLIEGPNKRLQLPAKLYDYLAAKRPILALSDNDELAEIIHTTGSGLVANYHDPDDAMRKLERLYLDRNLSWRFNETGIINYSVDKQAGKFSGIFNEIILNYPCA